MPDPGRNTSAEIRYEIADGEDMVVLVRQIFSAGALVSETIVGIIGSAYRTDPREFLNLRRFMNAGGVIGLNREWVD